VSAPPRKRALRRGSLLLALLLGYGAVGFRVFELQVIENERWSARALDQQLRQQPLPAARGTIYDRNGVPLAANREVYRISLAPRELDGPESVARRLRQVLGMTEADARRAVDGRRRWVVLPGLHDARKREQLLGTTGVYFETVLERFYPQGELALDILGRVGADGVAQGGLELELDELLRGRDGLQVVRRNGRGEPIPGAMLVVSEPVPGHDVYLTIDAGLQEIVQDALRQAVTETGAAGGDLLLVDPRTGEILASVTRRSSGFQHWRAVTDPYEPGSTLKPFFVAALLASGKATLRDSVWAERGTYRSGTRTVSDVSPHEWLTLSDALRVSSNIAMVKLSERLPQADHYGYLRDFGFGSPTGVRYPSEAAGVLRRPADWSRYSQGSLAMGYELSVTPLQLAMAYGALANDGVLMEPRLLGSVRSRDGRVLASYEPRAVRRVVPASVANQVAEVLAEAVATGTGREASLGPFTVAGKTGTVRIFDGRRYEQAYRASFAGFFPVVDPQLVFVVKLDRPQGAYYGGLAAAPVTRVTLAAALAARETPIDRGAVASSLPDGVDTMKRAVVMKPPQEEPPAQPESGSHLVVWLASTASLAARAPEPASFAGASAAGPADRGDRGAAVPRVQGLPLREAARVLHAAGFEVKVEGTGDVAETTPSAGALIQPGSLVLVRGRERLR
jgi:cell division protein FtsI (penicillin-binding protein 3)